MFATRIVRPNRSKDEAEKPFWISFADLMTALMVLFLAAMSVALLAVTKTVSDAEKAKTDREMAIEACLDALAQSTDLFPGAVLDRVRRAVNFGDRARFQFNSAALSEGQKAELRQFVPEVLKLATLDCGAKWLKRVVVEGFTDQQGSYLYNLDLSLRRSQSVICALYEDETALTIEQKELIRELFLTGGYSFNSAMPTAEESRRIELRLEFYGLGETRIGTVTVPPGNFGTCAVR